MHGYKTRLKTIRIRIAAKKKGAKGREEVFLPRQNLRIKAKIAESIIPRVKTKTDKNVPRKRPRQAQSFMSPAPMPAPNR